MRILIAIKGCHRDAQSGVHQALRETWLKQTIRTTAEVNYYFFMGRYGTSVFPPQELRDDEVALECPDDYQNLPFKTKAILAWALEQHYDFIYLCDTDTLVMLDRLLGSGFQKYDYMGGFNGDGKLGDHTAVGGGQYSWASGGPGYWLSAKAADLVRVQTPDDWAEDRWVGQVLGPHAKSGTIKAFHSLRYYWGRNGAHEVIDICLHYSSEGSHRPFDKRWLYSWWQELNQL